MAARLQGPPVVQAAWARKTSQGTPRMQGWPRGKEAPEHSSCLLLLRRVLLVVYKVTPATHLRKPSHAKFTAHGAFTHNFFWLSVVPVLQTPTLAREDARLPTRVSRVSSHFFACSRMFFRRSLALVSSSSSRSCSSFTCREWRRTRSVRVGC